MHPGIDQTDLGDSFSLICRRYAGDSSPRLLGLAVLALAWAAALCPPAWCRAPYNLDLPADSPVWWTLSESLSPAELRAALRDRSAHLARYRKAFEAGLVRELPEQGLRRLSFYVNSEQTPELTPMWRAFDVWADSFTELYNRAILTRQMGAFGLEATAVDRLLELATNYLRVRDAVAAEIEPKLLEFVRIQREVILSRAEGNGERDGGLVVERALESGDLEPLIEISGVPRQRMEELYAAWRTDPAAHGATSSLPRIQRALTAEEWNALRRYLLQRVVPGMGPIMDFDAGPAARPAEER